ncbi:MFS transporter [Sphingopyxis sp. 22461]|uniref:MFS transporter n=1 Tax=Sphingopyxis sp. 22461 TaxID=3453923 RepID=UPI003F871579
MSRGHRIVMLCALTQNLAFGIMFGSFGPLLPSTVERFDISLVTATMAMSMATLAIAASAPLIGVVVQRLSAGAAMTIAAALSACCYGVIATTPSFAVVMACYAILGVCAVTLGVIGPLTLVNQSFSTNRGKMLGLIHMPILLMAAPVAIAEAFPALGRTGVLLALAAPFLLVAPIIWWQTKGLSPAVQAGQPAPADDRADAIRPGSGGRRSLALVFVSLAIGIIAGSAVVYMAHVVPFGLSRGMTLPVASLLISLFSAFGIVGSPVAGWLCDRLGPYWTLVGAALAIATLWLALPMLDRAAIFVGASLLGFFAAPINTLHAAVVSNLYGPDEVGKAMGMSYLIKLPLIFGMAPLVALAVDHFGSYSEAFGLLAVITAGGAALCGAAMIVVRSGAQTPQAT